jgi:4,5-DOPA dioxygenase extradiol
MKPRLPALFIGHGNPMNALGENANSLAWKTLAADLPRPRVILAISAHWVTAGVAVTAMSQPETIHDFYGFPRRLAEFRYPAPGDPELARRVASLLTPTAVTLDSEWGLDHGTWSVLAHLYPEADIPVVQLSLNGREGAAWHLELARRLRPLRDEGVLILGSGNVVHNLGRMDWDRPDFAHDWASRFNDATRKTLEAGDLGTLATYAFPDDSLPDARLAVPTPEHYLPLLYIAALRDGNEPLSFFNDRIEYGAIGMMGVKVGETRPG